VDQAARSLLSLPVSSPTDLGSESSSGESLSACETEEDQDGSAQSDQIVVTKSSHAVTEFRSRNRRDFVNHEAAWLAQAIHIVGFDRKSEYGRVSRISDERTHRDRRGRIETVILDDYHRPWPANVATAGSRSPDLASPHSASRLSTSMNA